MLKVLSQILTLSCVSIVALTGCADPKTEQEIREEMNLYRPALRMTYDLQHDTRTNNILAMKESIEQRVQGARKVIVVSHIGDGGGDVAMQRAKKTALLLVENGEIDPRLYVRSSNSMDEEKKKFGMVELYVFPADKWSDQAFVKMMKTDSMEIAALGGVLRSDVARISMNEVFERRVKTQNEQLTIQLKKTLKKVGWNSEFTHVPRVVGPAKEYVLSLPENGKARALEAATLANEIAQMAGVIGLNIEINSDASTISISHGVRLKQGEKDE